MRRSASDPTRTVVPGWGMQELPPLQAPEAAATGTVACTVRTVLAGTLKSTFIR
jgi:hypothetical protein